MWLSIIISIRRGDRPTCNSVTDAGVRAGNEIAKHFAGNNVDVIIYAVEKSLDSHKFNLCTASTYKPAQKRCDGCAYHRRGGNGRKIGHEFLGIHGVALRQYRPVGQGETGKRIASLEGERKSFNKGKRDSEFKLSQRPASCATTRLS